MNSQLEEKLRAFKEQRIIEATKKRLTQKLITIAKYMGRPVIAQHVISNKLDDPWQLQDEVMVYDPTTNILNAEDSYTSDLGYHFDGLKCGINLCVTSMYFAGKVSELKATFNGYLVFAESEGELKAYAPFPVWENAMDMFYEGAIVQEKKRLSEEKQKRQEDNKRQMGTFWTRFRMLWGY